MYILVIIGSGLKLRRVRNGYLWKNQEVNRVCDLCSSLLILLLILLLYRSHFLSELSRGSNVNELLPLFIA